MFKKNIFFIVIFLFLFNSNSYSKDKIVYLDFNFVINNSNIGKKVLKKINDLNEKNIENLKLNQSKLKKEVDEINKIKNIASSEDIRKKISLHNENIKKYDQLKKRLSNEIQNKRNQEMNEIVKLINPILENYMKDNSIDIILNKETVYFAKDKYDISNDILNLTNDKYK